MKFITGNDRTQTELFPNTIEDYIADTNPARVIDAFVDSLNMAALGFTHALANSTGRPPYSPKDLLKLYLYGYLNRIRSSRRLEAESKRNLEVLWLVRALSPDHKTIANFRKDNPKALQNVFRTFTKMCINMELYGKELAAIDGSKFKAVNSKERNFTKDKLAERLKRLDTKINEYLTELEEMDAKEGEVEKEKTAQEIKEIINGLKERGESYKAYSEELEETGQTQKSLTDPDSRLMLANGKMDVCYNVQTAVDSKHKMIIEYEVTNKANDMNQITPMAEKVLDILETDTIAITADAGYASASDAAAAVLRGVDVHIAGTDCHICVPANDGDHGEIIPHKNSRCVYVKERNIALCPMGNILYPAFYKKAKGEAVFKNAAACNSCVHRCTIEHRPFRYQFVMAEKDFSMDFNDTNLTVKQVRIKPEQALYQHRKSLCEHPFGTIKRSMDGAYCLTKGLLKVSGEFALMFTAYNLKRAVNILGTRNLTDYFAGAPG